MLQAPVSIHAGVVIQILCHNDRGRGLRRLSRRGPGPRQAQQTRPVFAA